MKRIAVVYAREIHIQKYEIELNESQTLEDAKRIVLEGDVTPLEHCEYETAVEGPTAIADAYIHLKK